MKKDAKNLEFSGERIIFAKLNSQCAFQMA